MSTFPSSCWCGRRAAPGERFCDRHASGSGRPSSCEQCGRRTDNGARRCPDHLLTESERLARQPYRAHYSDPEYLANRKRRQELCGGLCECGCGQELGLGWQCDHVVPLRDGGTNDIDNLRCYRAEHHHRKTRADRRRRREEL